VTPRERRPDGTEAEPHLRIVDANGDRTTGHTSREKQALDLERIPPEAMDVCRAAVDPLEIAAALEAAGVTSKVAAEQFGEPDVFHLGRRLFREVAFTVVPARRARKSPRAGALPDLALGLLYTVPALTFATTLSALHLALAWWVSPLALVFGWAASQAVSFLSYSAAGRGEAQGWVMVWGTAVATASAVGIGVAAQAALGGGRWAAALVAVTVLYLCAFASLLAVERVSLIALALFPSVVGSLLYLAHVVAPSHAFAIGGRIELATAVSSLTLTVVAVLWCADGHWWRPGRIATSEWGVAAHHVVNGMCSGIAVAAIFVLSTSGKHTSYTALAAFPVMVTLGALDWNVRSYRARVVGGLGRATSTTQFRRHVMASLVRSLTSYLAALIVAATALAWVAAARGSGLPLALLGADVLLGATLFVGLIVAACTRIDHVVRCWVAGLAVFGASVVGFRAGFGTVSPLAAQVLTCAALGTTLIALLAGTKRTLSVPGQYA
jgi:hypothetical protein